MNFHNRSWQVRLPKRFVSFFMCLMLILPLTSLGSMSRVNAYVPNPKKVSAISAGFAFSLFLNQAGDVYAVGDNASGQLGLGDNVNREFPTKIPTISDAIAIAAGDDFSLVLLSNGTVLSFGNNGSGQLGLGDNTDRNVPTLITGLTTVKSVIAGEQHSIVINQNGTMASFGSNNLGQLGLGDIIDRNVPTTIPGISTAKSAAAYNHTMVVLTDGTVMGFGENIYNGLGLNTSTTEPILVPTVISALSDVKAIGAGDNSTIVIKNNGTAYGVGANYAGMLGQNIATSVINTPMLIPGVANAVSVELDYYHSLILTSTGTVYSFGLSSVGQLGRGSEVSHDIPTVIPNLTSVTSIAAGGYHSLALDSTGKAYSFGDNSSGQLGLNDIVDRAVPTLVSLEKVPSTLELRVGQATWINSESSFTNATMVVEDPTVAEISQFDSYVSGTVTVYYATLTGLKAGTTNVYLKDASSNILDTLILTVSDLPTVTVNYRTHVQNVGWQAYVADGATSGTYNQALRLEGININVTGNDRLGISYTTHVQNVGWQSYVADDAMSGTSNRALRLEAIKIELTGIDKDLYDIYYTVHAQNYGWLDWAKNGTAAGTEGYGLRLEAIKIVIVAKGAAAPGVTTRPFASNVGIQMITYRTHVQNVGWQPYVADGAIGGTFGRALRLETIDIKLGSSLPSGGVMYSTHVQNIGWMPAVYDGADSGTTGRALRLEAIAIMLSGNVSELYDIYYRVHAQNFGWLDWAMNGEDAGTAGFGYRLEAIQIVLVPKGAAAPGVTTRPFRASNES